MTTAEVASKLVELCSQGRNDLAIEQLYSPDIVSVEGFEMPGMPRVTKGIAGVAAKGKWWIENHEVHSAKVTDLCTSMEKFAVIFDYQVTFKPTGEKQHLREIAVFTVQGGKIVHEEFLYAAH
jgi:hypothetical protein